MKRTPFELGALADVDCRADGDRWTLVFVRRLRHPPETVWAALTDPARLAQWAPFVAERNLGTLGDTTLTMVDGDTPRGRAGDRHRAPNRRACSSTRGAPTGCGGSWMPTGGPGTTLTLRHTIDDRTWAPKVAAGWHLCLVVAEHLLDGDPVGPVVGDEAKAFGWTELRDGYAARLAIPVTD